MTDCLKAIMVRREFSTTSTSDLQLQTIAAGCQTFSLASQFKAGPSASFSADKALFRVPLAACQRWKSSWFLVIIIPAPPLLVPSIVETFV